MSTQKAVVLDPVANFRSPRKIWLALGTAILIATSALPSFAARGMKVAHNTPNFVANAKSLGSEDPSKTIEVSIWLQPHNRADLDALASQLYDRTSPNYRHFLTQSQFSTRFAPTADEAKTVAKFFARHNLKVVKVAPDNLFVRASGRVADVETAFHVQLNNYRVNGKTIRANDRDPFIDDDAAPLVKLVSGLDTNKYEHPLIARPNTVPKVSGAAIGMKNAPTTTPTFFTNNCFDGVETETFSTNNDGEFPIGTFKGNHLNLQTLTSPGCGYTPPEIQAAYNLTGLYAEGFDGTGQTIGIIDWCGSSTIQNDANVFSAMFGLPALTSSNFAITYTPRPSLCIAPDQVEINIDVEWAHAIAPGANINLIVPPSASFQDIDEAEYIAIHNGLANVLSGSYGAPEAFVSTAELENGNLLSEMAAVFGISTNFSTGDSGDFSAATGVITVNYPADSPFATAIGGVSLALNPDNSIAWQAGWGTNEILLAQTGFVPDPPLNFGFNFGSGGGVSNCVTVDSSFNCLAGFPKPPYQKKLSGKFRQLPDISWLGDPFTGAVILITVPGSFPEQVWQVFGGTSVACPMFSALWAIANQEAGAPLGQAAPYVYSMPANTLYDIVPVKSKTNVTASLQEPTLTNKYNAAQVAQVAGPFIDAIWDYPNLETTAIAITFGTDSSLKVKKGWDDVTGVGTPNAQAFADFFKPVPAPKK